MGKPIEDLDVAVFEWPDRFLVECEEEELKQYKKLPEYEDIDPSDPHLVDLSEYEDGWCACLDFTFNIIPFMHEENHRTKCKHIHASIDFKYNLQQYYGATNH